MTIDMDERSPQLLRALNGDLDMTPAEAGRYIVSHLVNRLRMRGRGPKEIADTVTHLGTEALAMASELTSEAENAVGHQRNPT